MISYFGHPKLRPRSVCVGTMASVMLFASALAPGQDQDKRGGKDKTDERLGERLIRKTVTGADEDLMGSIIRLMDEAARKLEIEFDAGDATRELQHRIMKQLDEAIKVAASQRRPHRPGGRPSKSDKRRMPKGRKPGSEKDSGAGKDTRTSSSSPTSATGDTRAEDATIGGDLRELRRAWGHLPMREREEVIQGISEQFLERYREWIERYYRALQENED